MASRTRKELDELYEVVQKVYDEKVKPHMKPEDEGRLVVVNVDAGKYVLGPREITVGEVFADWPDNGREWMFRVGHIALYSFGGGSTRCVGQ